MVAVSDAGLCNKGCPVRSDTEYLPIGKRRICLFTHRRPTKNGLLREESRPYKHEAGLLCLYTVQKQTFATADKNALI